MTILNPSKILFAVALLCAAFAVQAGGYKAMQNEPSIVEIAVGNEDFSTLVAALKAADLVEVLQFTINRFQAPLHPSPLPEDHEQVYGLPNSSYLAALHTFNDGTVYVALLGEGELELVTIGTDTLTNGSGFVTL